METCMRVRQWPVGLWRGAAGVSAALACVMASAAFGAPEAGHPPIVPGYYRLKNDAKADPATLGEVLLGELNCAACHSPPNSNHILTKGAPDLSNAGAR